MFLPLFACLVVFWLIFLGGGRGVRFLFVWTFVVYAWLVCFACVGWVLGFLGVLLFAVMVSSCGALQCFCCCCV